MYDLTWDEQIFVIVFIANLIIAAIYLLWYILFAVTIKSQKKQENEERLNENRRTYLMRFVVMVLCPVVGILFYLISYLLFITIFRRNADLSDVVFNKDRVRTQLKADEERERNIVPLEEAILVNEKQDLRAVMMNMLKGETQSSLAAISLALNTEDSETSHYAASILSDELSEFRSNVQKLFQKIQEEESDETEYELKLIDYMENILKQRILMELEQKQFVNILDQAAEILYHKNEAALSEHQFESVCLRLLEVKDFENSNKWCLRLSEHYPDRLSSYTCRLKLYFTMKNKEAFFQALNELKKSEIVIDNETLELVRVFS